MLRKWMVPFKFNSNPWSNSNNRFLTGSLGYYCRFSTPTKQHWWLNGKCVRLKCGRSWVQALIGSNQRLAEKHTELRKCDRVGRHVYRLSGWYHDLGLIKCLIRKMSCNDLFLFLFTSRSILISSKFWLWSGWSSKWTCFLLDGVSISGGCKEFISQLPINCAISNLQNMIEIIILYK